MYTITPTNKHPTTKKRKYNFRRSSLDRAAIPLRRKCRGTSGQSPSPVASDAVFAHCWLVGKNNALPRSANSSTAHRSFHSIGYHQSSQTVGSFVEFLFRRNHNHPSYLNRYLPFCLPPNPRTALHYGLHFILLGLS